MFPNMGQTGAADQVGMRMSTAPTIKMPRVGPRRMGLTVPGMKPKMPRISMPQMGRMALLQGLRG